MPRCGVRNPGKRTWGRTFTPRRSRRVRARRGTSTGSRMACESAQAAGLRNQSAVRKFSSSRMADCSLQLPPGCLSSQPIWSSTREAAPIVDKPGSPVSPRTCCSRNCEAQRHADRRRGALLGTTVSTGANMDGSAWDDALTRISRHTRSAADIVLHPHFAEEVERRRAARLAALAKIAATKCHCVAHGVAALSPHHLSAMTIRHRESNKAMSRET